jgi:hypothetical protein
MLLAAVVLVSVVGMASALTSWTQTEQSDFESGTRENLDTTSSPGDVMLATLDAVAEPSFETVSQWTYYESNSRYNGQRITGWQTKGTYSYEISVETGLLSLLPINYAELYQSVNLTNVDTIVFDAQADCGGITLGTYVASVRIDGTTVWSRDAPTSRTTYLNQSIDVSGYTGTHTLRFRFANIAIAGLGSSGDFRFDNVRCYPASGTLTSSAHDAGSTYEWGTISWTADEPGASDIKFQLRTTYPGYDTGFVGLDGSADTYYQTSGTDIWSGHNGYRYIQYKAFFTPASGSTPVLHDVTITYDETTPVSPTPELPTIALFSTGLLALAGFVVYRRKRRTQ